MISDDGGVTQPRLYALRIRLEAEPVTTVAPAAPRGREIGPVPVAAVVAAVVLLGLSWLRGRAARERNAQ